MKKLLLLIGFLPIMLLAQDRISIGAYHDVKLGLIGDEEHGYDAGTLDVYVTAKMQGEQGTYGYLTVYPSFEYAELSVPYKRYSVNAGYTFNRLFIDDIEVMPSLGYGFIDREGASAGSVGGDLMISYKVTDHFKTVWFIQAVDRRDFEVYYNEPSEIKVSNFIGVELNLN